MDFKEKVNELFKVLRKRGYTARQNFSCCDTCAWYDLGEAGKGDKAVFYNRQEADRLDKQLNPRRRRYMPVRERDPARLMLAWSGDANEVVEVAKSLGLEAEWNGSENRKVEIREPAPKPDPDKQYRERLEYMLAS